VLTKIVLTASDTGNRRFIGNSLVNAGFEQKEGEKHEIKVNGICRG